jgi:Zn-dependent alcohol dehydrogenase
MMCNQGGHVVTTGIANGTVSLPAVAFSILGRTHHAGQYGGTNPMRNIPRYVTMIERGQYDAKSLVTTVAPFEKTLEAYRDVMERATVTAVITFA